MSAHYRLGDPHRARRRQLVFLEAEQRFGYPLTSRVTKRLAHQARSGRGKRLATNQHSIVYSLEYMGRVAEVVVKENFKESKVTSLS